MDKSKFNSSHLWDNQRLEFIYENLKQISSKRHFNNKDFELVYNTHDCPVRNLFHNADNSKIMAPIFGNLKCIGKSVIIPFPQWYYRRDGSFINMKWYINKDWLKTWRNRKSVAVFRGGYRASCLDMSFKFHNLNETNPYGCGRAALLRLAIQNPLLLEVGLLSEDVKFPSQNKKQFSTLEEQSRIFKYVIYAEGNCGWADRLKILLTSGMLILMQQTPCSEWYFGLLKPNVHYIPIKNDWSDLVEKINWAKNNEAKSKWIISNAFDIGSLLMNFRIWQDYLYELIFQYSEKLC